MGDSTPSLISSHSSLDSTEAGAEPYHGTCLSVTGYGPPSVVLVNGDILTADIVIGLDGQSSLVRNVVLHPEDDHGRHPGREVFS
jgi:2-polyprenyl-6-methoxyphenol hydroxylase-like FAD-dependent oxidoreductase